MIILILLTFYEPYPCQIQADSQLYNICMSLSCLNTLHHDSMDLICIHLCPHMSSHQTDSTCNPTDKHIWMNRECSRIYQCTVYRILYHFVYLSDNRSWRYHSVNIRRHLDMFYYQKIFDTLKCELKVNQPENLINLCNH